MERKVTLMLEGMHCGHCAEAIASGLKKLDGVKNAEVVYTTGKARVSYDADALKIDDLVKTVKELGYSVKSYKEQ
jgi:copper chaperone CopZ